MKIQIGTVLSFLPTLSWASFSGRLAIRLPTGSIVFWSDGVGWCVISLNSNGYTIHGVRPLRDHLIESGFCGQDLNEALDFLADPPGLSAVAGVILS